MPRNPNPISIAKRIMSYRILLILVNTIELKNVVDKIIPLIPMKLNLTPMNIIRWNFIAIHGQGNKNIKIKLLTIKIIAIFKQIVKCR